MGKSYRLDDRSEEEFKKEIRERTLQERSLFIRWLDLIELKTGKRPAYEDTGCGKSGEYLEDDEVSMAPDFRVEGYGQVEVKFSKPLLTRFFHLKADQVRSYRQIGASILMINGADTDDPHFTLLDAEVLKFISLQCEVTKWRGFGGKPAYRIPVDMFLWRPLCDST
jgi:hypothetical protein